jgi:hypothetical protein
MSPNHRAYWGARDCECAVCRSGLYPKVDDERNVREERRVLPLTEQPWSPRAVASWVVIAVSLLGLVIVAVKWAAGI